MTNKVSLDKSKIKFVLLEGVHQSALDTLHAAGYTNIDFYKKALDGNELKEAIKDAHFIGLRSRTQLTAEMIEAAPKLISIGCFCIGTNQVDLNAAKMRGIPVFNAPFSNTRSVAELVLGEILLLMRNIPQANADVHRGLWNKSAVGSHEVRGKKLGIVGYGHIGSQLSIIAESLGMEVYFYDIENKLPLGNAKQLHTLEELLGSCDVISLHVPDLPSTRNLMSAERIAQIKLDSILINAARGTVVDIDALAAAQQAAPELPRGLLLDEWRDDWRELTARLGCVSIHLNHKLLNKARVMQLKDAGLRILVYTVNKPQRAAELLRWGVDCICTDAIDVIGPNFTAQ